MPENDAREIVNSLIAQLVEQLDEIDVNELARNLDDGLQWKHVPQPFRALLEGVDGVVIVAILRVLVNLASLVAEAYADAEPEEPEPTGDAVV